MGSSSSSTTSSVEIKDNRTAGAPQSLTIGGEGNTLQNTGSISITTADPQVVRDAFEFGGFTVNRSLDTVDRSVEGALKFAADMGGQAIASANANASAAIGASTSMAGDAMALSDRSQGRMADTFADALGYTSHITDLAMEQSARVDSVAANAMNMVAQGYESAKSLELGKNNVDNRYLIAVGMAVVGIVAFKAWGK